MDWSHVDSWLSSVFEGNPIPEFERTNGNLQLLNTLKNLNYNSMALIQHILTNKLHFKLSENSEKAIDSLATLAESLGMETVELSNYYTAVSKLTMDQMELQHESSKLDEMVYMLTESQKKADDKLSSIKSILLNLQHEAQEDPVQQQPHGLVETPTLEHALLEKKYTDSAIPDCTLSKLHELELKAEALELQYSQQKHIIESLKALPSDIELASIKIQKTEDDLHQLKQERERLLGEVANSVS